MSSFDSSSESSSTCRLEIADPRLEDCAGLNLDVAAIARWANHDDPIIRRYRTQLMDTLPVFVPMLVFREDDPFAEEIIGWIDGGEPLIDNIAGLFNVKKSAIQYLAGKPLSWISSRWIGDEMALAYAIDVPPLDKLPQSAAEWKIFSDFAEALLPIPGDAVSHVFRDLCVGGYQSSYDEMLDLAGKDSRKFHLIWRYLAFVEHWLAGLIESCRHTGHSNGAKIDVSVHAQERTLTEAREIAVQLVARFSAARIFRQALDWQRKLREAVAQSQLRSNDPELKQWPELLSKPFSFGDFQITSLSTIKDVLDEGPILALDVDTYLEDCTLGYGHLVSLHDEDRNHVGTAMFVLHEGGNGWISPQVCAHRRAGGEYAYQTEVDAIEALQRWLNSKEYQGRLRSLVESHEERRDRVQEKLYGLEKLDFVTMCSVMRQTLDNYDEVADEVSKLS